MIENYNLSALILDFYSNPPKLYAMVYLISQESLDVCCKLFTSRYFTAQTDNHLSGFPFLFSLLYYCDSAKHLYKDKMRNTLFILIVKFTILEWLIYLFS